MSSGGKNDGLCCPSTELLLPKSSFSPLEVIVMPPQNDHFPLQNGQSETKCAVNLF